MTFEELYEEMEVNLKNYTPSFQRKVYLNPRRFFNIKNESDCQIKRAEWYKIIENSFKPIGNKENDLNTLKNLLVKLVTEEKEEERSLNDHHIAKHLLDEFKQKFSLS